MCIRRGIPGSWVICHRRHRGVCVLGVCPRRIFPSGHVAYGVCAQGVSVPGYISLSYVSEGGGGGVSPGVHVCFCPVTHVVLMVDLQIKMKKKYFM